MTDTDIIAGVLAKEFEPGVTKWADARARQVSGDKGGWTRGGITAAAWGIHRRLGRLATRAELDAIVEADALAFYAKQYIEAPGFTAVRNDQLRAQLVDFGVNSGSPRAIRWLQRVLQVPVTSVMDDRTKKALDVYPAHLVNDALVAARLFMIDDITDGDRSQVRFEEGWESRALTFFASRPEATT